MKQLIVSAISFLIAYAVMRSGVGAMRSATESPLERAIGAGYEALSSDDRSSFERYLRRQGPISDSAADALFRRLASVGALRLSDQELRERASLQARIATALPVDRCAAFGKAGAQAEDLRVVVNQDPAVIESLSHLGARAAVFEIRGDPPKRELSDEEAEMAMLELSALYSEPAWDRLLGALENPYAGDEDVCWATRELYLGVSRLEESAASLLARLLASPD
jgi:hypothetical protein